MKNNSTKAKLTRSSVLLIEQLYAIDHESYGKNIHDMTDSEISHIVEKALISYHTIQMDELMNMVNNIDDINMEDETNEG